jgi:hypothetical protein
MLAAVQQPDATNKAHIAVLLLTAYAYVQDARPIAFMLWLDLPTW